MSISVGENAKCYGQYCLAIGDNTVAHNDCDISLNLSQITIPFDGESYSKIHSIIPSILYSAKFNIDSQTRIEIINALLTATDGCLPSLGPFGPRGVMFRAVNGKWEHYSLFDVIDQLVTRIHMLEQHLEERIEQHLEERIEQHLEERIEQHLEERVEHYLEEGHIEP
jgi:hypothetical protein